MTKASPKTQRQAKRQPRGGTKAARRGQEARGRASASPEQDEAARQAAHERHVMEVWERCLATKDFKPYLDMAEAIRASRPDEPAITSAAKADPATPAKPEVFRGMDDYIEHTLEDAASQPDTQPAATPWNSPYPRIFKADVEGLRHHRSGEEEVDRLAWINDHKIAKVAETVTGHSVEELLAHCTLWLGDYRHLHGWHLRCSEKFVAEKHQDRVRFLLLLAWWVSTTPNQDEATDIALDRVQVEIDKGERLAGEAIRRHTGGKASRPKVHQHNVKEVERLWPLCTHSRERSKIKWVAEKVQPKRIHEKTVGRIARKLGYLKKDGHKLS